MSLRSAAMLICPGSGASVRAGEKGCAGVGDTSEWVPHAFGSTNKADDQTPAAVQWSVGENAGDIGASSAQSEDAATITRADFEKIFRVGQNDSQVHQNLTEAQKLQMLDLLFEFRVLFLQPQQLGCAGVPLHEIVTDTDNPISQQPYRTSPEKQDEIRKQVKKLMDSGCIEESDSPYASPVVLVKKPDASWRFCIDYRALNSHTIRDVYPLPRIQDTLHMLISSQHHWNVARP